MALNTTDDLQADVNGWIQKYGHVFLTDIPVELRVMVARRFQPSPDTEWMPLAIGLGVQDQQTINEIKGDAFTQQKWPSEVLLMDRVFDVLSGRTFGQLLTTLLEMDHKKVLTDLWDSHIQDLLEQMDHNPKLNTKVEIPQNVNSKTHSFVFLTYAEDAADTAEQIISLLHKESIGVLTEETLLKLNILQQNPTAALLSYINQVQVVVPVISKQYLRNIKKPPLGSHERFIYELYTRNFVEDGCVNRKVRSVVPRDKRPNRDTMRSLHPVLDPRWYLWDQWEVFLDVIKAAFLKNKINS